MNKQPVKYSQLDKRWKNLPYRVKGENSTIGGSGCGPTSAAMLIETITGKTFTPVDACNWSVAHGYKALHNGTYQSYIAAQFADKGINCIALPSKDHNKVKKALEEGWYAIALMGKGTWTNGGHYIVVWAWDDKVRINDSASTKPARLNGDPKTFMNEVRRYWLIDAREYNKGDDEMLSYEQFKDYMDQYLKELGEKDIPQWAENTGEWDKAKEAGVIATKSRPQAFTTRAEAAAMVLRALGKSTETSVDTKD